MNAPIAQKVLAFPRPPRRGVVAKGALRQPIGQILVESGQITADDKLAALELQASRDAKLGQILISQGVLTREDLVQNLARQFSTAVADLTARPPDRALIDQFGAERCLAHAVLPWRVEEGAVLVASAAPEQFAQIQPQLTATFGKVHMVVTGAMELQQALMDQSAPALAQRAELRVDAESSCRNWSNSGPGILTGLGLLAVLGAAFLWPKPIFYALLAWTLLTLVLQSALKLVAWILQILTERRPPNVANTVPMRRCPTVSILVPLYREPNVVPHLIEQLLALDYPPEQLDICLIVEADDHATQSAVEALPLPRHMRQLIVPHSDLKTKPRALNFALEFCRGSIVGVYDAEDAPEPDQIRKVAERFHQAPKEVVCLQGILDYYNPQVNWIARCFTIEYANWFRVVLPGYVRLGLPIPLGGTTLFFRRRVLEEIGGWDAHNVTEDADLGIRLARRGYRAELIETVTSEEANFRVWPWVKQRSRWLKGYALTWAVHSRRPVRLLRELGLWKFCGVQLLLLGTLTQFAVAPALWSFWLLAIGFGHPVHSDFGSAVVWTIAGIFIASEAINILVRYHGLGRTNHKGLGPWVPTLYLYFPLATLAAYKAGLELLTRPFFWDKTQHGVAAPTAKRVRRFRRQA